MSFYDGNGNLIDLSVEVGGDVAIIKNAMDYDVTKGANGILPKFEEVSGSYHLEGRWYKQTINGVQCDVTNNSGSLIFLKVKGATTITINWVDGTSSIVAGNTYWAYAIDSVEVDDFVRNTTAVNTITLSDTDEHIVTIICDSCIEDRTLRWTNGRGCALSGITSDGTLTAIKPNMTKILYFGDSITEGIRTLGTDVGNSSVHAFPYYTSKGLYTIPLFCGYGATGVGQTGSFNTLINMIDYLYNGVPVPDDLLNPDLIVINMGQNDGTYSTDPTLFVDSYQESVSKLSRKYPGVPIACMIPFTQNYGAYIRNAVANNPQCFVIETNGWNPSTADGKHPNDAGSQTIATHLIPELQSILRKWTK